MLYNTHSTSRRQQICQSRDEEQLVDPSTLCYTLTVAWIGLYRYWYTFGDSSFSRFYRAIVEKYELLLMKARLIPQN